jgi:hypothetical protein
MVFLTFQTMCVWAGVCILCRVLAGERPECPSQCSQAIFKLMEKCWKADPSERPTFAGLKMDIQDAYAAEVAADVVAQAAQELDEQNLCVICMDKRADFALVPCGHKCVCEEDASLICRQGSCPVCRSPVQAHQRIW